MGKLARGILLAFANKVTLALSVTVLVSSISGAEPFINSGDIWLRSDLQILSDSGIVKSPITTWPLSWGDISEDINASPVPADLSLSAKTALDRVRTQMQRNLRFGDLKVDAGASFAERPKSIRDFQWSPRGRQEIWLNASYTGTRFAGKLQANYVDQDEADSKRFRLDGSYAAVALGNWLFAASVQDRWWGPGWNSTLLVSSNARPLPALTLQRNFSEAPDWKWLSWIGPWSTSVIWGQLEDDRPVPNARLFGWRVNARPAVGLEIGLLRAAQWCGSGRNCSADAFAKVLLGDTNLDEGVIEDVANQIAGFDARWSLAKMGYPIAIYGQFVGEDEAQGLPSKFLGQAGIETWGSSLKFGIDWRLYAEFSDTTCQFYEQSRIFNCAYNNGSFPDGYRYRGRSIGHSTDNDAKSFSIGTVARIVDQQWFASFKHMKLNRGGAIDVANSLTPLPEDRTEFDVGFRKILSNDIILDIQIGLERTESSTDGVMKNIRSFIGAKINLRN